MVNAPESSSSKNIWTAASDGDFTRVQELVEQGGFSPNIADENTYTPMHAAASWGRNNLLEYLVSKGGDINIVDEDGECACLDYDFRFALTTPEFRTPLFTVETLEAARAVVKLGGDPNHRNRSGFTASESLEEDDPDVAAYLRSVSQGVSDPSRLPAIHASDPTDSFASNLLLRAQNIMQNAETAGNQNSVEVDTALRQIVTEAVGESVGAGRAISHRDQSLNTAPSADHPESGEAKRRRTGEE